MRIKLLRLLPAAVAMLLCIACSYNPDDYSCFSDIDPDDGWAYGHSFGYMPEIDDSLAHGSLTLMVRHTNDYPYSNLWVEVESHRPVGGGHIELHRDTFCVELADVYGNWLGSGLGTSFQKVDTIYPDFVIADGAPLRLRHVMRPDKVVGIEQVGFIFNATTR